MSITKLNNLSISAITALPSGVGGKVLQVVSTTKTDTFTQSATTTFADITGLSVSITPSSASNKILVVGSVQVGNQTGGYRVAIRLVRGSTAIGGGTASSNRQSSIGFGEAGSSNSNETIAFNFLDSPSTTSSTTYKIQMISEVGATGYVNRTGSDLDTAEAYSVRPSSTITVMEIAG